METFICFWAPHKNLEPLLFEKIAESASEKISYGFLGSWGQTKKLSNLISPIFKQMEVYYCLTENASTTFGLTPNFSKHKYYNIVGKKSDVRFNDLDVPYFHIPMGEFVHEAYQQINPDVVTEEIIALEDASLISQRLDLSHELQVDYNHNEIVGIDHDETVPKEVRQFIKAVLAEDLAPLTQQNIDFTSESSIN